MGRTNWTSKWPATHANVETATRTAREHQEGGSQAGRPQYLMEGDMDGSFDFFEDVVFDVAVLDR
jgi:hypothetical protein